MTAHRLRSFQRLAARLIAAASLLLTGAVSHTQAAGLPRHLSALALEAAWDSLGDQLGSEYGYAVSGAGDVNGDGFADVLVGARRYDAGLYREGIALVFHGSPGGVSTSPEWTASGGDRAGLFGGDVAAAGDVNGDGYDDVIVGASNHTNLQDDRSGAAYVFHGSPQGLGQYPAWAAYGCATGEAFGAAVSGAGDLNGDGFADVIVGAPWYDTGLDAPGAVFVYYGSEAGLSQEPWSAAGLAGSDQFGAAVSGVGDLNADGFDDVVVGAPQSDQPYAEGGAVHVYLGGGAGLAPTAALTMTGSAAGATFGAAVSGAGDVNADGFDDVIVGAPAQAGDAEAEGAVFVLWGAAGGLRGDAARLDGGQSYSQFGASVAGGDLNHDGFSDLLVGAPRYDGDQRYEGRVLVFLGTASGPAGWPQWLAEGNKAEADFGRAVAAVGDVDGDGFGDFVAGAPLFRQDELIVGRACAFLGQAATVAAVRLYLPAISVGLDAE